MDDARWLASLEQQARATLPPEVFEYVVQGARDGVVAAGAQAAWSAVTLTPHLLRDVTAVDPGAVVLGRSIAIPFGVAPTTLQRAIHPEGELAMAGAVADAGGLMVVSSNAGTVFEELASTGVRWWVQCYLPADRSLAVPLLERAVRAGAEAVVLTLDTPVVGTKYPAGAPVWDVVDPALLRVNFDDGYPGASGSDKALDIGAADIAWLGQTTGLPVVVKGVLRPEDALRCVDAGAVAVWVSNHGGRQLDRVPATAQVLPVVVAAVAGRAQVYVDGGIRSGLDVVCALASGADAVFLGRLPLYALAHGVAGLARMHAEMRLQIVETMRLCGVTRLPDTRSLIVAGGVAGR